MKNDPPQFASGDIGPSLKNNKPSFVDAYALTCSTVASALAGLLSYLIAAEMYPVEEVGRASAWIAALLLLSGLGNLDMAHVLHRYLPQAGARSTRLVLGAYAVVIVASVIFSIVVLSIWGHSLLGINGLVANCLFGLAVVIWGLFSIQDNVLTASGKATVVPLENLVFGIARLTILISLATLGATGVLVSWIAPAALLLILINVGLFARVLPRHSHLHPEHTSQTWTNREIAGFAGAGYVGSATQLAVGCVLPLLVIGHLGEAQNAYFYIAWMFVINFEVVADNFGISLVVQAARNPSNAAEITRSTLRKQCLLLGPGAIALALLAPYLLRIFGSGYTTATTMLQFAAIGLAVKLFSTLATPIARIHKQTRRLVFLQIASNGIVFGATTAGLYLDGLTGIGIGYLAGQIALVALTASTIAFGIRDHNTEATPRVELVGQTSGPVVLLLRSLKFDFVVAVRHFLINQFAGAWVVPRVMRYVIYRAAGLQIHTPNIFPGCRFASGNVIIGANTFINANCVFEDVAQVVIGSNCQIGLEAMFITSHHAVEDGIVSRTPTVSPITIGDGAWIGARAVILPGLVVGPGCVVAAGAVVTKDCEPYGVYAGIPARRIQDLAGSGGRAAIPSLNVNQERMFV